jgi:hypothetical protein
MHVNPNNLKMQLYRKTTSTFCLFTKEMFWEGTLCFPFAVLIGLSNKDRRGTRNKENIPFPSFVAEE